MTTVYCSNRDCIHLRCGICQRSNISIGEDCDEGCFDHFSYLDTDEYSHAFYTAILDKNNVKGKAAHYRGKRIEYEGYVFYTTDRTDNGEAYRLTEERTGVNAGRFDMLKKRFDLFEQRVKEYPDVKDLPLAEYKGSGLWEVVERSNENAE